MKRLLTTTAFIALGFAAYAQGTDFSARISAELEAQGYTEIEAETEGATTVFEAELDGVSYEFIYDTATEELLETLQEDEDDEDEDDEDEDDEDEDDEDDSDDDDEDDDEDEAK